MSMIHSENMSSYPSLSFILFPPNCTGSLRFCGCFSSFPYTASPGLGMNLALSIPDQAGGNPTVVYTPEMTMPKKKKKKKMCLPSSNESHCLDAGSKSKLHSERYTVHQPQRPALHHLERAATQSHTHLAPHHRGSSACSGLPPLPPAPRPVCPRMPISKRAYESMNEYSEKNKNLSNCKLLSNLRL